MDEWVQYDLNIQGRKLTRIACRDVQEKDSQDALKIADEIPEFG